MPQNYSASSISIGCLVMNVALGVDGKAYQHKQEKLLSTNGVEYCCKRAKAIYNVALLLKGGNKQMAIDLCRQNSIAHSPHTGFPKGIEGKIVKRFVQSKKPAVSKRLVAAMRWYCSLTLPEVSRTQRSKALRSITGMYKGRYHREALREAGREIVTRRMREVNLDPHEVRSWIGRTVYADQLRPTSRYYSRFQVPKDLRGIPYSSMTLSFVTEPWVPKSIDERTPCFEMRQGIKSQPGWDSQEYVGKISFLQEQGCKARVVAQPSAWLQLAFVPLHNTVARVAERLFPRQSCVRDQVKGAEMMAQQLSAGKPVYCTDLSSATDRFPREFSLGILEGLGLPEWADALEEVANKPFECKEHPWGFVTYRVGQPMGLYSSFPLFHLSNMLLAYQAELDVPYTLDPQEIVRFPNGCDFMTVGDDMVFSDPQVESEYRHRLSYMGVEISEHKSFRGLLGEFAGFIAFPSNRGVTVFRPYKVPDQRYISNPIQFLDSIGSRVRYMPKRSAYWEKQWQSFQYTRPFRDLALESLIPLDVDTRPSVAANRGDTNTVKNMLNMIMSLTSDPLPDYNVLPRSTLPLFLERGMFDWYGYNPDQLVKADKDRDTPYHSVFRYFHSDPLMRAERDGYLAELKGHHAPDELDDIPEQEINGVPLRMESPSEYRRLVALMSDLKSRSRRDASDQQDRTTPKRKISDLEWER